MEGSHVRSTLYRFAAGENPFASDCVHILSPNGLATLSR